MYKPLALKLWSRPSSYMGATWEGYYSAGFRQHRDSDCLSRSNFRVALAKLKTLPAWEGDPDDEEACSRQVVREGHFLVGWAEWIVIHPSDTAALKYTDEMATATEDYPILDEEDFLDLEQEEANLTWKNCYSPSKRLSYIREHRSQFEFHDFQDLISCVRGNFFAGYASELLH